MFDCTLISFLLLNVRGLDLQGTKSKMIFFLQESHSFYEDVNLLTNMWGDKILFSHGSNRSAAVAICFNRFPGDVISFKTDTDGLCSS